MSDQALLVVTALGLCTPLGADPRRLLAAVRAGEHALRPVEALAPLPDARAAVVEGPDLRPWLKRRKDSKLLARPAELALAAAGLALQSWRGPVEPLGLYLGVGREPPDTGDAEPCLAAAAREGQLDEALLATVGRDLYPPLLPLRTLPNMALAHISINLGLGGANAAWAGGVGAFWAALEGACWALVEGRAPAALVGAADSLVDLGSARDRLRLGAPGLPGEAAVVMLLEPLSSAVARGAAPLAELAPLPGPRLGAPALHLRAALGDTGAAEGALALALEILAIAEPADAGSTASEADAARVVGGGEPGVPGPSFAVRRAGSSADGVAAGEPC